MNLQEMLEHTAKVYLDDRAELLAGVPDDLFSDASLVTFLNRGADEFARKTWRLNSRYTVAKAAFTGVTLATGVKDYDLHSRVLRVLSVNLSDSDLHLRNISFEDITSRVFSYPNQDFFDINSPYIESPGRPNWYAVDVQTRVIRFRATPSITENGLVAQMRVSHMPIVQLTVSDPGAVCEIEAEYHELLCMYAAGKALTTPNVDSAAARLGAGYLQEFDRQCREARNDFMKMTLGPARFRFGGWVRGAWDRGNY